MSIIGAVLLIFKFIIINAYSQKWKYVKFKGIIELLVFNSLVTVNLTIENVHDGITHCQRRNVTSLYKQLGNIIFVIVNNYHSH